MQCQKKTLQSQQSILTEKNAKPFEIDESRIAMAAPEFLIVDLGQDEDEDNWHDCSWVYLFDIDYYIGFAILSTFKRRKFMNIFFLFVSFHKT